MRSSLTLLFVLIKILLIYYGLVNCMPFNRNIHHRVPVIPTLEQIKFMQRFGYLDGGENDDFGAQYTETSISRAIVNIQKYGGIEQTGIIDSNTVDLMRKRRCGVKDINDNNYRKRRYLLVGRGWRKRELTYLIANWSPKIGEKGVHKEIKKALDMWAGYGNLTFINVLAPPADIVVAFGAGDHGDSFPFDGPGMVLAHAFFPYVRNGGNIHFDNDEDWTIDKQNEDDDTTDFFNVAIHEIGHSLGLAHSQVTSSIMFAYYNGGGSSVQLDYDDIMGMYELYIKRIDEESRANDTTTQKTHDEISTTLSEAYTTEITTEENWLPEQATLPTVESSDIDPQETTTKTLPSITFHGDFETVDDHKKHDTKHGLPIESTEEPAHLCDGEYDVAAILRQELFVFKGQYVWRFKSRGTLEEGYPVTIQQAFNKLPASIQKVDAVYEQGNGTICFFSGPDYWKYKDNSVEGPLRITDFGLPFYLDSIDAIFFWAKNEKTYIFKEHEFWRYNESTNTLDNGYPKNMTRWRGIPSNINGAITWKDGFTYFFKKSLFWRFDDVLMIANKHYPMPGPPYWFGCAEDEKVFKQSYYYHYLL